MAQVILSKNGNEQKVFESADLKEIKREYKRITRNAWRRKYAFNQVEFPLVYKFSWYEFPSLFSEADHYYLEVVF